MVDAVADFFIAGEQHADRSVLNLDLSSCKCAASSMMTATPALSSAPNSVVPSLVIIVCPINSRKFWIIGDANDFARIAGQTRGLGPVLSYDLRFHVRAGGFGRGIDVGIECNRRRGVAGRRFDRGHHDAKFVLTTSLKADGLQFFDQQAAEFHLPRRRWVAAGVLPGSGVDLYVAEKAGEESFGIDHAVVAEELPRSTAESLTLRSAYFMDLTVMSVMCTLVHIFSRDGECCA